MYRIVNGKLTTTPIGSYKLIEINGRLISLRPRYGAPPDRGIIFSYNQALIRERSEGFFTPDRGARRDLKIATKK